MARDNFRPKVTGVSLMLLNAYADFRGVDMSQAQNELNLLQAAPARLGLALEQCQAALARAKALVAERLSSEDPEEALAAA